MAALEASLAEVRSGSSDKVAPESGKPSGKSTKRSTSSKASASNGSKASSAKGSSRTKAKS
jgi:hypothetical protein